MSTAQSTKHLAKLSIDDQRWNAITARDTTARNSFVYAVETTGVYCRNVCPSRLPYRKNVRFFRYSQQAEAAGFRPCKRCRPDETEFGQQQSNIVAKACRLMDESEFDLQLDELAKQLLISPSHIHRIFKAHTGITPKQYAVSKRLQRVRKELSHGRSVTRAIYQSGYNSSSRFYESSMKSLGMKPGAFRAGGKGEVIQVAIGQSNLGLILVASTAKGICAIFLGDHPDLLIQQLEEVFPNAQLARAKAEFTKTLKQVVRLVENPKTGIQLPLDIRGTSFQRRVWDALTKIPVGTKISYSQLAEQLGKPKAVRAVASACAANVVAVAIPCHRVTRQDGDMAGYRWGIDRKRELIQRESGGK